MIVVNTETIKKYLAINSSLNYETLKPYIRQAERKNIKPFIGTAQYTVFENTTTDAIVKEAQDLCQEAISYFAMYRALPTLSVQITEAGIFAASTQEAVQANDKQYKELLRSFKKQGHETLDEMLKVMEANTDKFPEWLADASYTQFKSLLVNTTSVFNQHYNIFDSRQTFMAMKPEIAIVEKQFIEAVVQPDVLVSIKDMAANNENRTKVKTLLQQAIVCFTISKVVYNGLFVLDAEGIYVRFDVLPYEKVNTNVNLKINDFLVHTNKSKISEGEQFLKQAMAIIEENLTDFPAYVEPTDVEAKSTTYKTKSVTLL